MKSILECLGQLLRLLVINLKLKLLHHIEMYQWHLHHPRLNLQRRIVNLPIFGIRKTPSFIHDGLVTVFVAFVTVEKGVDFGEAVA